MGGQCFGAKAHAGLREKALHQVRTFGFAIGIRQQYVCQQRQQQRPPGLSFNHCLQDTLVMDRHLRNPVAAKQVAGSIALSPSRLTIVGGAPLKRLSIGRWASTRGEPVGAGGA